MFQSITQKALQGTKCSNLDTVAPPIEQKSYLRKGKKKDMAVVIDATIKVWEPFPAGVLRPDSQSPQRRQVKGASCIYSASTITAISTFLTPPRIFIES